MNSYPSRSEKREILLYSAAEKGDLSTESLILYPGEIRKLKKQGFSVFNTKPYSGSDNLYVATVDWSHAYGHSIPHIVFSYIHKVIETYPKSHVNSFAQELYVIAQRANRK